MGFSLGGFQSGGGIIQSTNVLAALVGQDIVARSFTSTQASGSDAFASTVIGARWHIGPGTTDYFISNGTTTITAAGRLTASDIGPSSNCGINFVPNNMTITATGLLTLSTTTAIDLSGGPVRLSGKLLASNTAPTISSGFGTSPSIVASNGSVAFTINVGTGGTAQNGVIALPAATNGWVVLVNNVTNNATSVIGQTATTASTATIQNYVRTTGIAGAWVASDVLQCIAFPY